MSPGYALLACFAIALVPTGAFRKKRAGAARQERSALPQAAGIAPDITPPTLKKADPTNALQHTWHIDPGQPFLVAPGPAIFKDHAKELTYSKGTVDTTAAESAFEFGMEMTVKAKLKAKFAKAFSFAAHSSLSAVSKTKIKSFRYDKFIRTEQRVLTMSKPYRSKSLLPDWKEFIEQASAQQIHRVLGDFYAEQVTLGGVFQLTTVISERETDNKVSMTSEVESNFKALIKGGSASLGVDSSVEVNFNGRTASTRIQVLGGESKHWLGLTDNNMEQCQEKWSESINRDNHFPVKFKLVPMWDLVGEIDVGKGIALERYMMDMWEAESAKVPEYRRLKPKATYKFMNNDPQQFLTGREVSPSPTRELFTRFKLPKMDHAQATCNEHENCKALCWNPDDQTIFYTNADKWKPQWEGPWRTGTRGWKCYERTSISWV